MEKHSVSRLIGAPPGYVGYDQGGQLTEAVRRRPYSVVLFDEIEKAHPDVLNSLLQVLDDGRLTDGQGRVVDFRNTVLIMTSNIGAQSILDNSDKSNHEIEQIVLNQLREYLRPEFINRIDEIVVYNSISKDLIREIVDIQVREFSKVIAEKNMKISLSNAAKDYLAEKGYSEQFGARPLKRAIYRELQVPLSKKILAGEIIEGESVQVELGNNGLSLAVEAQA